MVHQRDGKSCCIFCNYEKKHKFSHVWKKKKKADLVESILKSFHLTNEGNNWTGVAMASSPVVPYGSPFS